MRNKMVGFIFPGQGSQFIAMGKDIYGNSASAKKIFDEADKILDFNLSDLIFNGPEDELTNTINCQPAIFVVSIACLEALKNDVIINPNLIPDFVAGLSLGEYSALVCAEALNFKDGLTLVRKRAEFMEEAAKNNPGKMAAILGVDIDYVYEICKNNDVEVANINAPNQVVISGEKDKIDTALLFCQNQGIKSVILQVSGAFHSRLMREAGARLKNILKNIEFRKPRFPVVANVSAQPYKDIERIKEGLTLQITSSVLWEKSVRYMIKQNVKRFFEIGPSRVLKGLMRKIDPNVEVVNIEKWEDLLKLNKTVNV